MIYFKEQTKRMALAVLEDFFKQISKSRKYYWLIKDFLSDESAVLMWCGLAEIDESVFYERVTEILEKREGVRKRTGAEKNFQMQVERFLKTENVWYLKTWGNGIQRSGIPDLLLCCNGFFIGVELKTEDGKASALQLHELQKIKESGGIAMILKPSGFTAFKEFIRQSKKDAVFTQ